MFVRPFENLFTQEFLKGSKIILDMFYMVLENGVISSGKFKNFTNFKWENVSRT